VTGHDAHEQLRALPAVDRLAARLGDGVTPAEATAAARAAIEARRAALMAGDHGEADLVADARARLRAGPRRVLNGTGVIIHTNL
jgi:L-seryl-tRNA(Ser) seleniumtransferase